MLCANMVATGFVLSSNPYIVPWFHNCCTAQRLRNAKKSESPDLLESTRLHANDYMTVYFAKRSRKTRGNTERNVKSFCRRNVLFFELCR